MSGNLLDIPSISLVTVAKLKEAEREEDSITTTY